MKITILIIVSSLLFFANHTVCRAAPALKGKDKLNAKLFVNKLLVENTGLQIRGFEIFNSINNAAFAELLSPSLLCELRAGSQRLKKPAKSRTVRKHPWPEGGIISGTYEQANYWTTKRMTRSGDVIMIWIDVFTRKGDSPARQVVLSIHEEGAKLKLDDVLALNDGASPTSLRGLLKVVLCE